MNTIRCVFGQHFDAVFLDGRRLDPSPSLRLFNHSPDGFAWGYGGSGPAQLALAILYAVSGDGELSVRHHQAFKWEHVARWPQGDFEGEIDVQAWLTAQEAAATA